MSESKVDLTFGLTNATKVTRVTDYRETNVLAELRDEQHGDITTRHIKQAELLIVFKRPRSNTIRRAWVPMLELLKHKDYRLIHAYLHDNHPALQEGESPLFKHGIVVSNGVPFGAYIVSHEPAHDIRPYVIPFEDGDFGDYSAAMAQQLIDKKQVDMDVQEFHHMNVPDAESEFIASWCCALVPVMMPRGSNSCIHQPRLIRWILIPSINQPCIKTS